MKKSQSNILLLIAALLLVSLCILFPLLKSGFIVTDDGDWMIIRLTAFYQALADGQFPVRFLGRLNNNYGYPVANFLYPGFFYIGSILRLFKMSYPSIIEFILGGSVCLSVVFLFLWLRKFFSNTAGFIGACSLLVSPYFLYDLYKRGSVGEIFGTGCMIILLWTIESGFVWLIPPITALFLLSHNTLSLLFTLFLIGYIVIRKKWNSIIPFFIGACMTSFFWLPAFFERSFVKFNTVQVANPFDFKDISQTLLFMSFPFFVPLIYLFNKKKDLLRREYIFFSITIIVASIMTSVLGASFWKSFFFTRFIQFPYRMLAIFFITGPWLLAFFLSKFKKGKMIFVGLLFLTVFFLMNIPLFQNIKSIVHEEGFYTTNEGTTTVQDEYMPRWVNERSHERAYDKLVLFSGKGNIVIIKSSMKKIEAQLYLLEESVVQFNTVFYPGWGGMLDGKPVELSYENPKGLIQVTVPKGDHVISFEFRETAFRYIADTISSIGIILYGIYIIKYLTHRTKRKTNV